MNRRSDTLETKTGMKMKVALSVFVGFAGHAANETQFVGHLADVRKEHADRHAAFAVIREFPRRRKYIADVVEHRGLHRHRHRLPGQLVEQRLRIE